MTGLVFARILFFASLWKLLYASNGSIEIERRDTNYTNGLSVYRPDTFKIPSTMCSSDISAYCGVMGGHSVGGCKCECNSEETTFGFYDDQWNCTSNSKVHQHGGCSLILLSGRTKDSALITVPFSTEASIYYEMPTNHQRCHISPFKSSYLLCNGSWKILDINFVYSRFIMMERGDKQFFTFKNTSAILSDSEYNEVKGRILRITIGCYDGSKPIIRNCLLLKMQGTMKCPQFSLPPLPTTSPWTIPPTSATGTSANELQTNSIRTSISQTTTVVSKTMYFFFSFPKQYQHPVPQSSLPPLPTTSPWTIPPTSTTGTSANEFQTHSIRTSISQTTTVGYKRKKNGAGEKDGGNTGLIAGVVVGVIGLTLIIVTIVIIKRRRTKRENEAREREKNPQTAEDGSQEMYTYANAISIGNTNGRPQSYLDPVPVADYVNQGNPDSNPSDEVEYEIMTNTETADESIKQKQETSEIIDSTTYGSLVGNVPHIYGSLKGPHKTHEDETDRQVTCASQNMENNTYQQLNTFGQQNHEYQAPNWSA